MKKSLLSMIAGLSLLANVHGQSLKPVGELEVSYIPERIYATQEYNNQFEANLKSGIQLLFNPNLFIEAGGNIKTYMDFLSPNWFQPKDIDFGLYALFNFKDFQFFIYHDCHHLLDQAPTYVNGNPYGLGYSDETKIGVKYKW